MTHECQYCQKGTFVNISFEWYIFVCPNCAKYSINTSSKKAETAHVYDNLRQNTPIRKGKLGLFVGNQVMLEKVAYYVVGVIQKRQAENYKWMEYILRDAEGEYRFLSESEGHWILLEELDSYQDILEASKGKIDIEAVTDYETFYSFEPVMLQGFFDFDPFVSGTLTEKAKPPYLYSKETYAFRGKDADQYFLGEHFNAQHIKKSLPGTLLPVKHGVGIVQPFLLNVRQMGIVFLTVAVLLFGLNFWYYNNEPKIEKIYSSQIPFGKGTDVSSPSFQLSGRTGTLQFDFYSPVDNNWASCDIALVNEGNGDQKYFSKDIEYYHGYDGGESWIEGSTSARAYVCGVTPGKYHLEFSVSHDASSSLISSSIDPITGASIVSDPSNSSYVNVDVVWRKPSIWNLNFVVIGLLIILIVTYFFNRVFENSRRANFE